MADIKKYLDLQTGLPQLVTEIKAADTAVLEAAKKYTDEAPFETAGASATAEKNAKDYADAEIAKVNAEVAKKATTEALEAEAKARGDKDTELQGLIEATDAKAVKNAEDIAAINNAETGILKQAKDYTDTEVGKVQGAVDQLNTKVGELPEGTTATSVVDYVNKKTEGIATDAALGELNSQVAGLQTAVQDIQKDYLVEADKTELQGNIDELAQTHATDKAALEASIKGITDDYLKDSDKEELQGNIDGVSAVANAAVKQSDYDTKVAALEAEDARIAGLVEAEATKAREEEGKLNTRLEEVEAFFKLAEGEQLDTALDTLKELQDVINGDGAVADQMLLDIAKNAEDIANHIATDHDFAGADAALKSELEGKINAKADTTVVEGIDGRLQTAEGKITTVEGKVTTLEGKMTTVEGAVATKVEQEAYNTKVAALEEADANQVERIAALEDKFGDGENSVSDMIADGVVDAVAQAEAKDAQVLVDAKAYTDQEVGKDRERLDALEAIDHDHANKAELDLIASGDKAKWDEAYAKRHEHANAAELAKIADGDVAKWNAAEQNAKDYAKGLDDATNTKVDGVDARLTEAEGTLADKADASVVTALSEKVTTNETNIASLQTAINSFTPITAEEVAILFQ